METKTDTSVQTHREQRRRFLRLFGTAAAALPVTAIIGCSDDQPPTPASQSQASDPEPQSQQDQPTDPASPPREEMESAAEQGREATERASSELQKLSLDDPTAKALGYKHDAANVDLQKYPQRGRAEAANHYCSNCTLFQGSEGDQWGPCTLFPGKLVNANGWCSGYTPRPT